MIRPALKTDATAVAPLIIQAMGDLAQYFTNATDPEVPLALFSHFFRLEHNQYSFQNTLVFEADNKVAGSLVAYDGAKLAAYRKPFLEYIAREYGVQDIVLGDETTAGEYYLDTLAVNEAYQGKGIGKKLIAAAINKAALLGIPRIGLLVARDNPAAKRLYGNMGFAKVADKLFAGSLYEHLQRDSKFSPADN